MRGGVSERPVRTVRRARLTGVEDSGSRSLIGSWSGKKGSAWAWSVCSTAWCRGTWGAGRRGQLEVCSPISMWIRGRPAATNSITHILTEDRLLTFEAIFIVRQYVNESPTSFSPKNCRNTFKVWNVI